MCVDGGSRGTTNDAKGGKTKQRWSEGLADWYGKGIRKGNSTLPLPEGPFVESYDFLRHTNEDQERKTSLVLGTF